MAFYYNAPQQQPHHPAHAHHNTHHGGRSRRGPRLAQPPMQAPVRTFRTGRSMKELAEAPVLSAARARFEACKGFELDDDLEFCPGLLTEDDLHSVSSAASDRSSLSSGSPSSSPLQQQAHPSHPHYALAPAFQPSPAYSPVAPSSAGLKLHQPVVVRSHKAIPIVNPSTGMRVASPPNSVSPGRMQPQPAYRRW